MVNLSASLRRVHSDRSGAVMVTGVFFASFLVGALWYLMGIGDAIVFRNRMQEAADHGAFTSAALHAKGMNFIAACNIVMLALVAVHIVLGIVHDFALAACILSLGTGCGGFLQARRAYERYASFFKPMLSTLHELEGAAAAGYPYVGAWKAYEVGKGYERTTRHTGPITTLAISPAMIPTDEGVGLPVKARPFDALCEKLAVEIYGWAKDHVSLPGLGFVGSVVNEITGGDDPEDIVKAVIGEGIRFRYCNRLGAKGASSGYKSQMARGDSRMRNTNMRYERQRGDGARGWNEVIDPGFDTGWAAPGPYVPTAANGSDALKVWAVVGTSTFDQSLARVHVASRTRGRAVATEPAFYVAEAELYYDCTERWSDDACNGRARVDDNAAYTIRWRARLRRLELEPLGWALADLTRYDVRSGDALSAVERWHRRRDAFGGRAFH